MKVLTVATGKGGTCKTTTVAILAVRAVQQGKAVLVLDLNADQGSLTQWHGLREPTNISLLTGLDKLTADVKALDASGYFDYLIIDTPPTNMKVIEAAIAIADAVIIPVRSSILDLGAIDAVVEMCRERDRPHAFLMTAQDGKMKTLNVQTFTALKELAPVFETKISYRQGYITAMALGKVGGEIEKDLQSESATLWDEVVALLRDDRPARGRRISAEARR